MMYLFSRDFFIGVVLLMALGASQVQAVNWNVDSGLYMRGIFKDNFYLQETNEESAAGLSVSPDIVLKGVSDLSQYDIKADVQTVRYRDEAHSAREQDEGVLEAKWIRKLEKGDFQISSSYEKKSSIDSALEDAARFDGAIVDIYTGKVGVSWRHQLADSLSANLSVSYDNVTYDEPHADPIIQDARLINFVDYEQIGITASFSKIIDEKNSLNFILYGLQYEGVSNGIKFKQNALPFGYEFSDNKIDYRYSVAKIIYAHQASETEKLIFSYGASETKIENFERLHLIDPTTGVQSTFFPVGDFEAIPGANTRESGLVYELTYNKNVINDLYSVSLTREREADSTGGLVEKQRLRLGYSTSLSERLGLESFLFRQKTNAETSQVIANISQSDLDRYTFSLLASRRMSRLWTLRIEYQYSEIQDSNKQDDVVDNVVYISSGWRWNNIF